MRQDVAVVGDEVGVTMDAKLRRQKEIRTQHTTLITVKDDINQMSQTASEKNHYRVYVFYSCSMTQNIILYIVDGLPCISELISSVLSRAHQFLPLPAESHETATGNTQRVHKCTVSGHLKGNGINGD